MTAPSRPSTPARPAPEEPAIGHEDLRRLWRHWNDLRGPRNFPLRGELEPFAIAFCLGHVALVDLETSPFRPRYRLVGTRLVELWGQELRGKYVDEVYHWPLRKEVVRAYRQVHETASPLYHERVFDLGFRKLGYFRLMLPFASEAGQDHPDIVCLAIYPSQPDIRRAADWRELAGLEEPLPSTGSIAMP